ncbi:MADS-box protein SOC1-like [Apium graveolens]|uniref:MADS-box protein SOC1-like n=1 Tax=Apium graveolens TaxID=4045 RepID=UPI003D7A3CEF
MGLFVAFVKFGFDVIMHDMIECYRKCTKDVHANKTPDVQDIQHLKLETTCLAKKIELLEVDKCKLLGEGLGSCTLEELQQVEQHLEKSVCTIRDRKMQVYNEKIEQLKEKEKILATDNDILYAKVNLLPFYPD